MVAKLFDINRYEIINQLKGYENIGVELGVAEGHFSFEIMKSNKFKKFYGIDSYANFQHNDNEYKKTKKKLSKFNNYYLIRDNFNNSLDLFEDYSLDFIYIDGFAGTGNNGGKTLFDWIKKLKIGGICSGDDYHDDWPLLKKTVNYYVSKSGVELYITNNKAYGQYSEYPSWFFRKEHHDNLKLPNNFLIEGLKKQKELENKDILYQKKLFKFFYRFSIKFYLYHLLKKNMSEKNFKFLLNIYKKYL